MSNACLLISNRTDNPNKISEQEQVIDGFAESSKASD